MASTTSRSTRQATAARKRAAAKPVNGSAPGDLDFEPIRIAADDEVPEERVPLFYIGDTEYTIPKDIPPGVALQYLRTAGEIGEQFAAPTLLTRVLGAEAYEALESSRALKDDQLQKIIQIVIDLSLGKGEKKEGKAATR
ncbi:hypothetical protein [Streptomyces chartreusis]|uniref:hypothetical protein n=1 Tax=Streptomyces chartreusis TaxID=1969 RepID=UPI00123E45A0|nr:hypothetical protein [Streptomyces chartreusis]QEV66211.1 hypothetical protein CP983_05735 [Streptomyces chartreusis]GGW98684.1 hypothetical protein GCM10010321_11350 [Streptomyces chartreusis]